MKKTVPAATAKSKTRKYFPLPLYWICGRMWSFYEVVELFETNTCRGMAIAIAMLMFL